MPGIFISYRRESTAAFAGRLFDRLSTKFGVERTFIDIDMIEPGEDFVEVLERKLADAAALVVLIGRDWLDCKDTHGVPRLKNPDDFVRLEVATALRRKVRVIPVLLDGASMPASQQLPEDLALLSRRQAVEVSHARFHQDVTKLVDVLDKLLNPAVESRRTQQKAEAEQPAVNEDRARVEAAQIAREREAAEARDIAPTAKATAHSRRTLALVGVPLLVCAAGLFVWYFAASPKPRPGSDPGADPATEPAASHPVASSDTGKVVAPLTASKVPTPPKATSLPPETAVAASQPRINPKDGLSYVFISPGNFTMGCSPGDTECNKAYDPSPHPEQVTNGFWLGQTEVTHAAWKKVNNGDNRSHFKGDQLPVESVNWSQAGDYCKVIDGRLPTETEWEYAARAGTTGPRYDALDAVAWYSVNSSSAAHPAGLKQANAFGLYDMLGNVWEWTDTSYNDTAKVVRGGSWASVSRAVRVSARSSFAPAYRNYDIGFRCVWVPPDPAPLVARVEAPRLPEPQAPSAGAAKVNPKDGLTYVFIPPGNFTVGCSPGDNECFDVEKPPHPEQIANGFWLGRTEVTQAAWKRVNNGGNRSHFKGDQLPVESVDWNQASAYCKAIGGRLPTEIEWEYAARAGTTGPRYGDLDAVSWYSANSGSATHPAGLKQANAFGLYDMLGNVLEWADTDHNSAMKVVRGGSWSGIARNLRASFLGRFGPADRSGNIGLRCVGEPR